MTFTAKQAAILLISAVAIAGVTFAVGYLSKGKQTAEKAQPVAKPNADAPAAPGAIAKKLDTDAIIKEREIEKSTPPAAQFTFQKTLMKDASPAKEPPPPAKPAPAEPPKPEIKAPPKEKPRPDSKPTAAKSTPAAGKMFAIQAAAFSSRADADKLAARLEAKRFMVNIQEFKEGAGVWYRVRVGVYKTEQAANRDLGKVKAEGAPRAFVTGY